MIEFTLNGKQISYSGNPEQTLLHVLREEYMLTSVKDGCSGEAFCGACTLQINDKAALSCVTKMKTLSGKSLLTIDGLDPELKDILAAAFSEAGAVQCGFCSPGYVMRAKVLLDENPNPSEDDIKHAIRNHFCRCTGYIKIIKGIQLAAEYLNGLSIKTPPSIYTKHDAYKKAIGTAPFVDDLRLNNMLYGVLKFSSFPRAVINKINTGFSAAIEGVKKILTWKDIPGERYSGLIIPDWPMMRAEGETTAYTGDVLAVVVAESEAIARKAADLIEVDYTIKEALTDYKNAENHSIKVQAQGNLLEKSIFKQGKTIDAEIKKSAFSVSAVYETQRVEHAFMETEAAIALPGDKGKITLFCQSQGIYEDRTQLAKILDLAEEKINVILVPTGGGFGGKEDLTVQHHACLAAKLCGCPVKVKLNRRDSFRMHSKRHPMTLDYTLACDKQGNLTALKARISGDTGAYASVGGKVLERAAGHAAGAYYVPNADIEAKALYTNNVPCGAMRGFGVNQAAFAMESSIDELCKTGGFDPYEFRYKNALTEGKATVTGQILTGGVGVRDCLEALKKVYDKAEIKGLACAIKNTGIGNGVDDIGNVILKVLAKGKLEIKQGWTEMGQGVFTAAKLFVHQLTNIPVEDICVTVQTDDNVITGMTTASRGTSLLGNAVIKAAEKLNADLKNHTLTELKGKEYAGQWKCTWTTAPGIKGKVVTHYSYGYAAQLAVLNKEGKLVKVTAAHDAGKIINPRLFEGQIEGSIHMGTGYALSENFPCENGVPVYSKMSQLGLIKIKDMPETEVIGIEVPDPNGPLGAKGVGEIGLVPTAPAIANAYAQYDGIRRYSLPLDIKSITGKDKK